MVQPSQQYVAPCVKGVEWRLGLRGVRMVAAFWAGISVSSAKIVEVTQDAGVVPCRRRATIGTPLYSRFIQYAGKPLLYTTPPPYLKGKIQIS